MQAGGRDYRVRERGVGEEEERGGNNSTVVIHTWHEIYFVPTFT